MNRQAYMDEAFLKRTYELLLRPRLAEERMLILLRQGRLAKWFSGIGQEAVAVGASMAMHSDEYILPLHRNLGVFTTRNVPLTRLFSQFQGKMNGFTKGRDRSFHFGSREHRIVGMISHLGPQLAVASGIALAEKLSGTGRCTLVFTGEGGTSEGDFHEALNLASVWDLPVIFLIENNGFALSTPLREQYRCKRLSDRGAGYGIKAVQVDGNDVLTVYHTIKTAREYCLRNQRPYLVECMTFRMRGHEEASGVKYVPAALLEEWEKKDPVKCFGNFLLEEKVITPGGMEKLKNSILREINEAVSAAFEEPDVVADTDTELRDMYAPLPGVDSAPVTKPAGRHAAAAGRAKRNLRFIDAISEALRQALQRYPRLVLMGQDIAAYGGAFKVTEGFLSEFGEARIRNTPLCESAVIGAAYGMSIRGYKTVVEMQFADFVSMGMNQIVNNLAKSHYRWAQPADVVIRMPAGAGTRAGPFHSQSNEAWFVKTPGLKVVYPAFPADAKGLLLASIEDPNPVLYFEHKYLYRKISGEVEDDYQTLPLGKARLVREGGQVSLITYGLGVHWALDVLDRNPGVTADLIDLRTLLPWDRECVRASVRKTGRALILHEDTLTGGIGGEIAAWLAEHCFEFLDAPVMRCASLDTAVPVSDSLEDNFLAGARLEHTLRALVSY